jgi:hypothetical protein
MPEDGDFRPFAAGGKSFSILVRGERTLFRADLDVIRMPVLSVVILDMTGFISVGVWWRLPDWYLLNPAE